MSAIKDALYSYVNLQIGRTVEDYYRLAWIERSEQWQEYLTMLGYARQQQIHSLLFQYTMSEDRTLLDKAASIARQEEITRILQEMNGGEKCQSHLRLP